MKVSLIVPIYKKPLEIVKKCLDSLIDQTYEDKEIICVFDGPDIVVESLVDKLVKDQKISKKLVIEHGGACKARNAGFKESTGEVISFWDSDCTAEPKMVEVWVKYFEQYKKYDIFYGGYKWSNPLIPAFRSEEFDSWKLKQYNFIGSMFPCRREKVVEWDETLEGLQDWDYWRRVVDGGANALFIGGHDVYAVTTEFPDQDSISGQYDKRADRIKRIREKFNDPVSDIVVWGGLHSYHALKIAKYLNADYLTNKFYKIRDYKMNILMGFNPGEFESIIGSGEGNLNIIYWLGYDVDRLVASSFVDVTKWIKIYQKYVNKHICADENARKALEQIGIEAEVVPLPQPPGETLKSLPAHFKVLAVADDNYMGYMDAVIKAMPDIEIQKFNPDTGADLGEYTVILQFTGNKHLLEGSKNALLNGRYVVSNVQEPFAGYVNPDVSPSDYINGIVTALDEIFREPVYNVKAVNYYEGLLSPDKFVEAIKSYMPVVLEVA